MGRERGRGGMRLGWKKALVRLGVMKLDDHTPISQQA